jgi:glutathione S-transferase
MNAASKARQLHRRRYASEEARRWIGFFRRQCDGPGAGAAHRCGELLTENPVVLQYVADQKPESDLAPQGGIERYRLQQWLNFITSELHKVVFIPLLDPASPDASKSYAREKAERRFAHLNSHLEGQEFLLDHFTVADAYLVTVLNWARFVGLDLAKWPAVKAYNDRMLKRPNVAKALAEEMAMYQELQARRGSAKS